MEKTLYTHPLSSQQQAEVSAQIALLGSEDGPTREAARKTLLTYGQGITPYLEPALHSENEHTRWEAAKIFGAQPAPDAAPYLVEAMTDEVYSVSWLAAEALIKLGQQALAPLMTGLIRHFDSLNFRNGAHHVLHSLERAGQLPPETLQVLNALRAIESEIAVPFAAQNALKTLSQN
ncbi:MAG: HEAT repeat domain-containing protein [Anaerolineales bacterium]|nr:HEAT repeat domain-containing protein [Anaerolineales bacterium]